jgi:hypothetical protein
VRKRAIAALFVMGVQASGCGGTAPAEAPNLTLAVVRDSVVTEKVLPLLPAGAVLARSVTSGDFGLDGENYLVVWADRAPRKFHAGVVSNGKLIPFPELHTDPPPDRIGAVMLVQADSDPAGEVVILIDRSDARPDRLLALAKQSFESVVVDYRDGQFVRDAKAEALVAGHSRPNEIRQLLEGEGPATD